MAALLLALAALAAAAVWHMRRPPPRRLALSMARFLPELAPAEAPARRLSLVAPLASLPFWLRIGGLGLLVLALLPAGWLVPAPAPEALRLRLVLDVSDGMRLPVAPGGPARIEAAREVARAALARAGAAPGGCAEVMTVARRAVLEPGPAEAAVARAALRPEGNGPEALMAAAAAPSSACPPGVVLVVTDLPRPAGAGLPPGGPVLLWHQLGAPLPNAGLRAVRLRPAALGGAGAALELEVVRAGPAPAPRVIVDGPGGARAAAAGPEIDGVLRYTLPLAGPGRHTARLDPGGAYDGDDRAAFAVAAPPAPVLDWREPALPPPPGIAAPGPAGGGLVVGPLAALTPEQLAGPVLATHPGWEGAGRGGTIGAFAEDAALLGAINLDVLEAHLPRPLPGALPPGFRPVLTDAAGRPLLARRAQPPGAILPAPLPGAADPDLRNLSLTLFYAALLELAQPAPVALPLDWRGADGRQVAEAWRESDTARPAGPPADLALLSPGAGPAGQAPLWPWLVVAALALLLAERVAGVVWRRGAGGAV